MDRVLRRTKGSFDVNYHKPCGKVDNRNIQGQAILATSCIGWRYYIGTLGFLCLCVMTLQRISLAVAVVNMVNFTSTSNTQANVSMTSCPLFYNSTQDALELQMGGEFDWSPELQGFILGAGFLGFSLTPMIGGVMAEIFGAKQVLLWGNSVSALAMLVSPIASSWNAYAVIAAQLVRGMAQGVAFPATFRMVATWAPRSERGFISSLSFMGLYGGCIAGGPVAGFLCEAPSLGWRSVFYFSGGIGILFSILFMTTFYETPRDHPWISKTELKYITDDQENNENQEKPPIPWLRMFTSISTYALLLGMFGQSWIMAYLISVHPTYLGTILHYPIAQNGLHSSLPYFLVIIASLSVSSTSDWLYRKKYVGVDKLRKGCAVLGSLGFTLSMVGVYVAECNLPLNTVFFAFVYFSAGVSTPGAYITPVDMTPNFAATLLGILSTVCNLTGFIIPVITGYLTKNQTLEEWHTMFLINIGLVMSFAVVFAVFGSANVQPWNFATNSDDTKEAAQVEVDSKENQNPIEIQMNSLKFSEHTHSNCSKL